MTLWVPNSSLTTGFVPSAASDYFSNVSTNAREFSRNWIAQKILDWNLIFFATLPCPHYIFQAGHPANIYCRVSAVEPESVRYGLRMNVLQSYLFTIAPRFVKYFQIWISHSCSMANSHLMERWRSITYSKCDDMFRLEFDCDSCRIDIETIGHSSFLGPHGEPTQYVHPPVENTLILRNLIFM